LNRLHIQRDKDFTGQAQRLVRLWRIGQKDYLWMDTSSGSPRAFRYMGQSRQTAAKA